MYIVGVTMGTLDAKPDVDPAASEALRKQIEVINRALTEELEELAPQPLQRFENGRPTLRKSKLWWRNGDGRVKLMLLIAHVILIVIFIIVTIACGGFTFEKC
jgi:hypothetical protein